MSDSLFSPSNLDQLAGAGTAIDTTGQSWQDSQWWLQLQPGSWRGIAFVMDAGQVHAGRRVAVHEYPYRPKAWPEDIGLLPRRFGFTAFLVGDDVYSQRDAMVQAAEQAGPGTLVHPTMGAMQCVLLDFTATDRRERGRYVELTFAFILAGDVSYPASGVATGQAVQNAAGALNEASASDLSSALAGLPVVPVQSVTALAGFTGMVTEAVNDPTMALHAVTGLQGSFGRFSTGNRSTLLPPTATVASVLSAGISNRSAVLNAVTALQNAAGSL